MAISLRALAPTTIEKMLQKRSIEAVQCHNLSDISMPFVRCASKDFTGCRDGRGRSYPLSATPFSRRHLLARYSAPLVTCEEQHGYAARLSKPSMSQEWRQVQRRSKTARCVIVAEAEDRGTDWERDELVMVMVEADVGQCCSLGAVLMLTEGVVFWIP